MKPDLHLWLIPILPLVGAAINGLLGRRFPTRVVAFIGNVFVGSSCAMAWWTFARFFSLPHQFLPYTWDYATWIRAGSFAVSYGVYLDQLSMVMVLVVTNVGFLIHIYSIGYMAHEGGYYRFFSYLNLFMFFMLTLVLANNYLVMFIGWEGVGLASYLLIGFFFLRDSAASAGKKAFIVNRIGDFGFLIALFLLIKHFGSLDFSQLFPAISKLGVENAGAGLQTVIGLLLMMGAAGKSAQLPLYVWLPDAMEGPTPVSALIHAATMVTAGVYMVARSHVIFNRAPSAMLAVAIIGCLTALFAATIGMAQTDIKRVLAYSTISQLGYMFLACGVAAYSAGIFHLMTHAFFKGLLFLAAGSVIHALGGEQDMRRMGGLRKHIPWTFWTMTAATFAIAGIPPFAGFFSKDEILWTAYSSEHGSWIFWAVGLLTAFLTSFYMFRLWFLTFFGEFRGVGVAADEHQAHADAKSGYALHEVLIEIVTPEEFLGAATEELTSQGGYVTNMVSRPDRGVGISGNIPIMKARQYVAFLDSATQGRATAKTAPSPAGARQEPPQISPKHHIHESPRVMVIPLVILAVLSVIGGWIGWPESIGGSQRFDQFVSPAFGAHAEEAAVAAAEHSKELLLASVSVLAALFGLFLAWLLYQRRRDLPDKIASALGGLYTTVRDKYYVDEGYAAAFVQPLIKGSTYLLWRGIDEGAIDATANDSADGAQHVSDALRHMQSGNVRSYAGWVAAGAAAVIAYMVYLGVR